MRNIICRLLFQIHELYVLKPIGVGNSIEVMGEKANPFTPQSGSMWSLVNLILA